MAILKHHFLRTTALAALLAAANASAANLEGSYAGFAATAESTDVSYDKRLSFRMLHDRGDADDTIYGLGVLVGYRMPLAGNGVYLSGEIDWTHHEGAVRGRLGGVPETPGDSPPFTRNGDSWPESWRLEKERSCGLTFKLGMPFPSAWAGPGASLYALAGVRRMEIDFVTRFGGCEAAIAPGCTPDTPELCSHYSESQNRTMTAWTWGAGLEKIIGETTALRGEIRYAEYGNDRRTNVYPAPAGADPVTIPRDLDGDAIGLSLGLVRYF